MEAWKEFAGCKGKDVNLFFDYYEQSVQVQLEVDEICGACPVRKQCLEWAIAEGLEGGVFGRKYLSQTTRKKKKRESVRENQATVLSDA